MQRWRKTVGHRCSLIDIRGDFRRGQWFDGSSEATSRCSRRRRSSATKDKYATYQSFPATRSATTHGKLRSLSRAPTSRRRVSRQLTRPEISRSSSSGIFLKTSSSTTRMPNTPNARVHGALPPNASWGTSSRVATLGSVDSAKVEWAPTIAVSGFVQCVHANPAFDHPAQQVEFRVLEGRAGCLENRNSPPASE